MKIFIVENTVYLIINSELRRIGVIYPKTHIFHTFRSTSKGHIFNNRLGFNQLLVTDLLPESAIMLVCLDGINIWSSRLAILRYSLLEKYNPYEYQLFMPISRFHSSYESAVSESLEIASSYKN